MTMNLSLNNVQVILGSKSPRRKQLLEGLDISFTTTNIDADESFSASMNVHDVAKFLAEKKSKAFFGDLANSVLITSDTTVINGSNILNKPADISEAMSMIMELSGKSHIVNTGVCLRTETKCTSFYVETEVEFADLSEAQIRYYVQTYKPFDKAGGYGIQEWIGMVGIRNINGCYYNVMGLPTQKLYEELCRFIKD